MCICFKINRALVLQFPYSYNVEGDREIPEFIQSQLEFPGTL